MDELNKYKQQHKLFFFQFLFEIPNSLILALSVLATGSVIVWMDFVDSLGQLLRKGTVSLLTGRLKKDLKYEYNYGTAKLEDIAALVCDGIVMFGLAICTVLSVYELFVPRRPSGLLIFVAIYKSVIIVFDLLFLWEQYKIKRTDSGVLTKSTFTVAIGTLMFDALELCSMLLVWAFKNHAWTWYFSPIISILIAVFLGRKCIERLKKAIAELTDRTLSEDDQMKILKVLTRHFNEYSEFRFIKSHTIGGNAHIELVITFPPETTYGEMIGLKNALQSEISELIKDSSVSISIT